jgi:excisionase family DNA binding protein
MLELSIEQRLEKLQEDVFEIKGMMEKLLQKEAKAQSSETENIIMDVRQVARFASLNTSMIYTKCSKGELPFFKIGTQYRFKRDEIIEWIKKQKESSEFSVDEYVSKYLQKNQRKS